MLVLPGWTRNGIDLITTQAFNINNFGNRNFVGFTGATPGQYYAVQVPASQIAAIMPGELLVAHSVLFNTRVLDASTTPKFAEAMLTTGVVNADGTATIDLAHPLERDSTFVGQDDDFSPFFLKRPRLTGYRIRQGVDSGEIQNLFLVLRLPTTAPFPGVSALPPLIGLDGDPELEPTTFRFSDARSPPRTEPSSPATPRSTTCSRSCCRPCLNSRQRPRSPRAFFPDMGSGPAARSPSTCVRDRGCCGIRVTGPRRSAGLRGRAARTPREPTERA